MNAFLLNYFYKKTLSNLNKPLRLTKILTILALSNLLIFNILNAQTEPPPPLSKISFSAEETVVSNSSSAQKFNLIHWLQVPDSFSKKRFWTLNGATAASMTGAYFLLNNVWYSQFDKTKFHYFNDGGEWLDMDKAGHVLTAYTVSKWFYGAARWTGLEQKKAAWWGMGIGTTAQLTLEILDGKNAKWGFSWADLAANTSGCALFGLQQVAWNEQRFTLKVSNTPRKYAETLVFSIDGSQKTTLKNRAADLFGDNYTQTFFKDYNALIFWLSMNPRSFWQDSKFPKWLNVAVGMGAENMYGGYRNAWPDAQPIYFLPDAAYPRYRQFYLSLDIDLSRIKTKSRFVNMLARTFNFVKIPAPAVEFNTLGKVKFHPFIF